MMTKEAVSRDAGELSSMPHSPCKGCAALENRLASLVLFPQVKHGRVKLHDSTLGFAEEDVGEVDLAASRWKSKADGSGLSDLVLVKLSVHFCFHHLSVTRKCISFLELRGPS